MAFKLNNPPYNKEELSIPIYRVDATICDGPGKMIMAEVNPKGLVMVEKPKTCYVPLDEERIQVSALAKTIPGIQRLIS